MEKLNVNSQNNIRTYLCLLLFFILISCDLGNRPIIEVYKTDSVGYVVKCGDYFRWSDIAVDTTKMKNDAETYLYRKIRQEIMVAF